MHNFFIGEILGTMTLVVFGCGVVANCLLKESKGQNGGWIVITAGWCFGVVFGVFVAQAAGSMQADLNPAVTLAKYFLRIYSCFTEVMFRILAELVGAFIGAVIVWLAYLSHWKVTDDQNLKLAVFATGPAIKKPMANLITETIGTFILVFGIGALASNQSISPGLIPYLVGMLVWGIGLSLGGPTGYAINPARDFGPRLAHEVLPIAGKGSSNWQYAWVPIVGPILGAVFGAIAWSMFLVKF
ncbi:MAG: aquaporin family protein [Gammaproteobacteria bacterium]|nr:aquaporin family protein [Gammaproteobacteria bacterium]